MWWKSGSVEPVTIDFRLLPIKMVDHTVEAGFFAKRRGFAISKPFKKVEQVKNLFPDASLTKKAQEEVKLMDLFAEVA